MKLTFKDFKVGDIVICVKQTVESLSGNYYGGEPDNERLIIGENYKIEDVDFHFPNSICVKLKGPYYYHSEFVPIECFSDIAYVRDLKINKILNEFI